MLQHQKHLRESQMTALKKPKGGIRGIVVGDVIRQLVAKQFLSSFETVRAATMPFQFALSGEKRFGGGSKKKCHQRFGRCQG